MCWKVRYFLVEGERLDDPCPGYQTLMVKGWSHAATEELRVVSKRCSSITILGRSNIVWLASFPRGKPHNPPPLAG
jgi:hypothetical protein